MLPDSLINDLTVGLRGFESYNINEFVTYLTVKSDFGLYKGYLNYLTDTQVAYLELYGLDLMGLRLFPENIGAVKKDLLKLHGSWVITIIDSLSYEEISHIHTKTIELLNKFSFNVSARPISISGMLGSHQWSNIVLPDFNCDFKLHKFLDWAKYDFKKYNTL